MATFSPPAVLATGSITKEVGKMNKATFDLLGRIFGAEIAQRLPYQSRNKGYAKLAEDGLCEIITVNMHGVRITGWILTHKGRIEYCEHC